MRFLVDASTLIASARCEGLDILRRLAREAWTTSCVADEVLVEGEGTEAVRQAIADGWLGVIEGDGAIPRLGPGEASMIRCAESEDIVVLDDRTARLEAQRRGLRVTGLLGLLVNGCRRGVVGRQEALDLLDALAKGDFRMSVALYRWARNRLS